MYRRIVALLAASLPAVAMACACAIFWAVGWLMGGNSARQEAIDAGWGHECEWNTYYSHRRFAWGPHRPWHREDLRLMLMERKGCLGDICRTCRQPAEYCGCDAEVRDWVGGGRQPYPEQAQAREAFQEKVRTWSGHRGP